MIRRMLALEKWGLGRHPLLAEFAFQVALSAEDCYTVCNMARQGKRIDGADLPLPVEAWGRFYRDEQGLLRSVNDRLLRGMPEHKQLGVWFGLKDSTECFQRMTPEARREAIKAELEASGVTNWGEYFEYGAALQHEWWQSAVANLRRAVALGRSAGRAPAPRWAAEALRSPDTLFFYRVWLPCWLEYGVKLPVLVAKAQDGDVKALDMLLRLDKTALELPEIRRRYLGFVDNKPVFEGLTEALGQPVARRLTKQKVKVALAALVFKVFAKLYEACMELEAQCPQIRYAPAKLTAPDVRRLFNAAAADARGLARDIDLPGGDHAFYMALRREERFWDLLG